MKAKILVNKNFRIGEIDRRIYGSFIEHLGRAVYGGIYEPDNENADECGFRKDVIKLVKELSVPAVRYPGGNFVSGYHWEDGTGDKSKRPQKLEPAWGVIETNQFGVDEFQEWAKRADTDIIMAVNLGTRGPEDARNLLEYCNAGTDTYYANMRRENGFEEPFGIRTWCLGNEMDGPWQIGYKTAEEYGKLAAETAKQMRLIDPDIELVACGSSGYNMETFGEWELTVLEHTYEQVDYISMHQYYGNENGTTEDYLGKAVHMDQFIKSVVALCDAVKAKKHTDKTICLSFDEWNVWFHSNQDKIDKWQIAPSQLEDVYDFRDALLVGTMLMTLQNNCDRVKIACLAQLVNVIAPIMTKTGGGAWVQTIFYPFMYASVQGRGEVLRMVTESDTYRSSDETDIPYLAGSVIHHPDKKELVVFAVNRSLEEDMELSLIFEDFGKCSPTEHIELYSDDLDAVNTQDRQEVTPRKVDIKPTDRGEQRLLLKKHSWNMIKYSYEQDIKEKE